MTVTRDGQYLYAGRNEFYRWGKKAQSIVEACKKPNDNGFYNIPTSTNYFAFGTSDGKYGDYAKWNDTFFSVNKAGYIWAKVGTPKADDFLKMLDNLLNDMREMRSGNADDEE